MNSLVATYRFWRMLTAPTPRSVRRAIWLRDTVRDGAGLLNDVLPDPEGKEEHKSDA